MAGHSKWAQIKHKKAKTDAQRGKVFTRLIREITVAARHGGGDPDGNPRLRLAIQTAKGHNMPADNIQRAIKKGTGDLEGQAYDEFTYEGYGPSGVALLIDVLTDNRNRTAAEVRHALTRYGGNLGETGSVGWNFETFGVIRIGRARCDEESLMNVAIEAGADDVRDEGDFWAVYTPANALHTVAAGIEAGNLPYDSAELERVPGTTVALDAETARKMLKLMDMLEELDDVQRVSANFDIPDEVLQEG